MCQKLLGDARLYGFLFECDQDLAAAARAAGCGCGGVLHSARYPRKPRGGPAGLGPEHEWRLSFCCDRQGCRGRVTPPSVRFLGRRVYLAAVVVLVSAMMQGPTPPRVARLAALLRVSCRTLVRWRRWWQTTFALSAFWRVVAGRFATPVAQRLLPRSLLERFEGDEGDRLLATLRFLSPITTSSAGSAMAC